MLSGRVALVTGGSRGIGEAAARLFSKEGASVVIADVLGEQAHKLAAAIGADKALGQECDVSREEDVERAVQAAVERFGGLDIMVNNAGIAGQLSCPEALLENQDFAEFDRLIQINLRGVALGIKHAARAMKGNRDAGRPGGGGCIINVSSVAGLIVNVTTFGDPAFISAGYGSSKAGVIQLTKVAACELAPYHIRCNAIAPGYVATPMLSQAILGDLDKPQEDTEAILAQTSPLRGVAITPQDIANSMLYLASDMGRCVNGTTLSVDCGLAAGVAGFVPAMKSSGHADAATAPPDA